MEDYRNHITVEWQINSECQNGIRIYSEFFAIEQGYDHFYIQSDDLDTSLTGDEQFDLWTSGSNITVIFTADGIISHDGFTVHWSCEGRTTTTSTTTSTTQTYTSGYTTYTQYGM